ncbi:MAG: hypothetical protein Q7K43_00165 [Candidatus Woesearchaeota archaeon]|nr:hypothetical protein [Candidatus Woesearchaeota archaeon]
MDEFQGYNKSNLVRKNDAYRVGRDKTKAWQNALLNATALAIGAALCASTYSSLRTEQKIQAHDARMAGKQDVSDKTREESVPEDTIEVKAGGD